VVVIFDGTCFVKVSIQLCLKSNHISFIDDDDDYIRNMVSEDKGTSSKNLYSFIKSKKCDGSGVAPLKKDRKTYADASEKAELLNEQFLFFLRDNLRMFLSIYG
jgi:hypothetical protein